MHTIRTLVRLRSGVYGALRGVSLMGSLSGRAQRDMAGIVSTQSISFGLVLANLLKPSASEETGRRTGLSIA
jgi:hypothetical protein